MQAAQFAGLPSKHSFSDQKKLVLSQIEQSTKQQDQKLIRNLQVPRLSPSSNECLLSDDDNELNEKKCPRQKPFKKSYFQVSKKTN